MKARITTFQWTAALALAPWLLVVLTAAGPMVALHFLVAVLLIAGVGALALTFGMRERDEATILLALPVGFIFVAATLALIARGGMSIRVTGWVLAAAGLLGVAVVRREVRSAMRLPIRMGWSYVLLSLGVCAVYFASGAWRDGIVTPNGGFQWMYVDTQYHMAVAAAIKTNHGPPAMPGLAVAPLAYHFASSALVATVSAMTGISIADASVRVVRAIGLISLMLAAVSLGRALGRRVGNAAVAGVASVAGLFFYGALSALFVPQVNTTAATNKPALLVSFPDLAVIHDGGWFSHLILGHSELWGGIGLLAALALLTSRLRSSDQKRMRLDPFIVVPAFVACLNVIAGVGLIGVTAGVYAIAGLRRHRNLFTAVGVLIAGAAVVWAMGYVGSPSASGTALDLAYAPKTLPLWSWLFVGLGIRLVAAEWLREWRTDPVAWTVGLFILGYLALGFLVSDQFDSHNLYAIKFLAGILSVYAFAWLGGVWERGSSAWRSWLERVVPELLRWSWRIGVPLVVADVVAWLVLALRGEATAGSVGVWSLKLGTAGAVAVTVAAGLLLFARRRAPPLWRIGSVLTIAVMAIGFFAWLPSWTSFGLDRLHMTVTLSPAEVSALYWVRDSTPADALVATNHHAVAAFQTRKDRSYGYRVLAERPVLLEGWEYGEMLDPRFDVVRRDNAVLFNTTDADSADAVVNRYGVRYIITAPGTDLGVPQPEPWLTLAARFGSVKIYRTETDSTTTR